MSVGAENERFGSVSIWNQKGEVVCGSVVLDVSIVSFVDCPFQLDKEPFFHQDPAYICVTCKRDHDPANECNGGVLSS